jgi:hypothetical protein
MIMFVIRHDKQDRRGGGRWRMRFRKLKKESPSKNTKIKEDF